MPKSLDICSPIRVLQLCDCRQGRELLNPFHGCRKLRHREGVTRPRSHSESVGSRAQRPGSPDLSTELSLHLMFKGVRWGPTGHRGGILGVRADRVPSGQKILTAAAPGAWMGQDIVVSTVLQLAGNLASYSAFQV